MASYKYTAYANTSAMISKKNPTQNVHGRQIYSANYNYDKKDHPFGLPDEVLFKFDIPEELNLKYVTEIEIHANVNTAFRVLDAIKLFDENKVTYDIYRLTESGPYPNSLPDRKFYNANSFAWESVSVRNTKSYEIYNFLHYGCRLEAYYIGDKSIPSKVYGSVSPNRPYLVIWAKDLELNIHIGLGISNKDYLGFINRKEDAKLEFFFRPKYGDSTIYAPTKVYGDKIKPQTLIVKWKETDKDVWHQIDYNTADIIALSDTNHFIKIPANTFTKSRITLQLIVQGNNGSTASNTTTLTTIDVISKAVIVKPNATMLDNTVNYDFSWKHSISTGTKPTKSELEYSTDGVSWKPLATVQGEVLQTTIKAGTLPSGTVQWRVRTYNSDEEPGEWSETANIVVRGAPQPPIVTEVDQKPRLTIRWQSGEQEAFEVKAGNYDSGAQYGVDKEFKVPVYLPDGNTSVSVRVQNEFGLWSNWSTTETIIKNQPGAAISLRSRPLQNAARLQWEGNAKIYYVYRDGQLIAKTTDTQYTDNDTVGKHLYQVRGIIEEDYYTMSNDILELSKCQNAAISQIGVYDWIPLQYRRGGEPPVHGQTHTALVAYNHYVGFADPIPDISPYTQIEHSFDFTFKGKDLEYAQKLLQLVGKPVVYKDCYNNLVLGVLDNCSVSGNWRVDASFTVRKAQVKEVVQYD